MTDAQQLAAMIHEVYKDRLDNGTPEQLALEVASLRAFILSTLDSLEHLSDHVRHNEITNKTQMLTSLAHLIKRITNSVLNLEDVRLELQRHNET